MMFSAAAIAVVSEVNPDEPGASFFHPLLLLFFLLILALFPFYSSQGAPQPQLALARASYNNTLIQLSPMIFHRIELGMTYEAVVATVGKSALYCDSGESTCNAENGEITKSCLETEFIRPNKTWFCHWDGTAAKADTYPRLEVWFVGLRSAQVIATMPDGNTYRRDSGNTIDLERSTN